MRISQREAEIITDAAEDDRAGVVPPFEGVRRGDWHARTLPDSPLIFATKPWISCGWDRQRLKVVAFVQGWRTDQSGRALRRKLGRAQVNTYRTDKWPTYGRCFPGRRHQTDKGGTSHIVRHHLNFRTRVKRLQRRTICFSKSAEMHDAVIKLYVHDSDFT